MWRPAPSIGLVAFCWDGEARHYSIVCPFRNLPLNRHNDLCALSSLHCPYLVQGNFCYVCDFLHSGDVVIDPENWAIAAGCTFVLNFDLKVPEQAAAL